MSSTASATTATGEDVLLDICDGVATLTLNRPRKGNAFTPDMISTIRAQLKELENNPDVRALVLTGSGKYFCSGMDLSSKNQGNMKQDMASKTKAFIDFCTEIKECKLPTIAKLNGAALGGGIVLLFLADIRLMAPGAYIQFAEVKRGLIPAMISTFIVPSLGPFLSKELFITGRRVGAAECKQMGFVTEVASSRGALDALTHKYTSYLMTSAPLAMTLAKQLVDYVTTHEHSKNVVEAQKIFKECMLGGEMKFGLKAFRNKKRPDWGAFKRQQLQAKL